MKRRVGDGGRAHIPLHRLLMLITTNDMIRTDSMLFCIVEIISIHTMQSPSLMMTNVEANGLKNWLCASHSATKGTRARMEKATVSIEEKRMVRQLRGGSY